jgi:hypothetical protein
LRRKATGARRSRRWPTWDLDPGTPIEDIAVDRVFIGSCTNSRIEDLRAAARVAKGQHVNPKVRAMVVPGSQAIKHAAEQEGLHRIFLDAGFEWRESGCSMCLGMNPDILQPGERCASTSNRNFEGRQGRGGTDASGESDDGGGGGDCGAFYGYSELAIFTHPACRESVGSTEGDARAASAGTAEAAAPGKPAGS